METYKSIQEKMAKEKEVAVGGTPPLPPEDQLLDKLSGIMKDGMISFLVLPIVLERTEKELRAHFPEKHGLLKHQLGGFIGVLDKALPELKKVLNAMEVKA